MSAIQLKIFIALAEGKSIKDCAFSMARSPKTIEHHWAIIKRELGITNKIEAAHLALRFGVVHNLYRGWQGLETTTPKKL